MSRSPQSGGESVVWRALNVPRDGGTVVSLALSPDFGEDSFVCAGSALAIHCSRDGGQSWNTPSSGHCAAPVTGIAFSPDFARDRSIFATVLGQGFWRSRDGGESWEGALGVGGNTVALSPAFASDRTILIGTDEGFLLSTTGGDSWEKVSEGLGDPTVLSLALSPYFEEDGLAFAVCDDGLYRSTDGGRAWEPVREAVIAEQALVMVAFSPHFPSDATLYVATEDAGVLRSTDGGETWLPIGPEGGEEINTLLVLSGSQGRHRLFAGVADGHVYCSADQGESWQALSVGETSVLTMVGEGDLLLSGSYSEGVLRSTDGGDTWHDANEGLVARNLVNMAVSPTVAEDQTLFVVGPGEALHRSRDGGETWAALGLAEESINMLALSPAFPQEPTLIAVGETDLFRSKDAGDSWQKLSLDGGPFRFAIYSPMLADRLRLAVVRGSDILLSRDHGDSWQTLTVPWMSNIVVAAAFSPGFEKDHALVVVAGKESRTGGFAGGTVWRTVDEGQSWQLAGYQRSEAPWLALALPPDFDATIAPHRMFIAWGAQVLRPIITGAKHWMAEQLGDGREMVLDLATSPNYKQDRTVYVATNRGVWRSRNEGLTWHLWAESMSQVPILAITTVEDAGSSTGHRVYALSVGGILWVRE